MTARVLIVDDIPFNINLLKNKLKPEYYEIHAAMNGREALEKAKEIKPDIILMDVMMPVMDGFTATKILKSSPETVNIPVVMLTALDAQEDKVNGLLCGADDFLTKPINDAALLARIKSLLRLKNTMDEFASREKTNKNLRINLAPQVPDVVDNVNVFIITDDKSQMRLLADKLIEENFLVDTCDNTNDAITYALKNDYDLIIVDTQIMDTDGLKLCFDLKRQDKLRYVPILVIIDEYDENTLIKSLESGINDYILSPIDVNELYARALSQVKRYRYQEKLRKSYYSSLSESIMDPLTNLYNRRYLDIYSKNLISQTKENYKPFALLMLDLDHFKRINDTYGHLIGDQVLKMVAKIMIDNTRSTDLCARVGGEEFVIIMTESNFDNALVVAERIRNSIKDNVLSINSEGEEREVRCTVSIGVTIFQKNDNSIDLIIDRADKNLLKAKKEGRDITVTH